MTSIATHDTVRPGGSAALASLLTGALAIALAPIFVRVSELGPVATAFHRLAIALPFFLVGVWLESRDALPSFGPAPRQARREDAALMVLAGLMLAGDLALWHVSITMTSVANATLFNNCAPIFVVLLGWAAFGQRVGGGLLVALAVALSGMALLIGDGFVMSPGQLLGDAIAVATAAFYAVYLLLVKRLRKSHSTNRIMAGTSAAAAAALLVAAIAEGGPLMPSTIWGWGVVLALGLACHVLGQGLITQSLAHLPVTFSSIGLLIQPIAAAALAWLLFGEALGPIQWIGGGLVLVGITLARRSTGR